MDENKNNLIPQDSKIILNQLYSALSIRQQELVKNIKDEILSNLSNYQKNNNFRKAVEKVEAVFLKKTLKVLKQEQLVLKRALVAKMALHLPIIVDKMNLPASILELYPAAFERLSDFLKNGCDEPYDSTVDFYLKDIRFVLGLSVPCGAQIVDLNSRFSLPTVVLSCLRSKKFQDIKRYVQIKGYKRWFQIHTESRFLKDFNENGWDRCYLRIADLLERKKDISGVVGTSWFYDPQLLKISPRLAYLQKRPLEAGAIFLRHGSELSDINNAIKTSNTRRRLYQEGSYMPVCYSMLWPRKELISWARQSRLSSHG